VVFAPYGLLPPELLLFNWGYFHHSKVVFPCLKKKFFDRRLPSTSVLVARSLRPMNSFVWGVKISSVLYVAKNWSSLRLCIKKCFIKLMKMGGLSFHNFRNKMKPKIKTDMMEVDGSWSDVVNVCKDLGEKMKGHPDDRAVKEWEEWRPKHGDSEADLRKRTAEHASLGRLTQETSLL